jgi:DNA (cytosine-5)-methyltransferase 1
MLNGLDLFSGIGGMSKALEEYVRPLALCEIDPYCQGVLLSRMAESVLPNAPIWDDVRTLRKEWLPSKFPIEIIYGGFPCQGISVAGLGKGLEDERSGLFYEIIRLCCEIKPRWIFLENVPAICSRGGTEVIREIAKMGYDARWCCISASSIGALHKRERWFLLAYFNSKSNSGLQIGEKKKYSELRKQAKHYEWDIWPENESPLLGVDDVIPFRVDRARALGNSVCIKQTKEAFKILMGLK